MDLLSIGEIENVQSVSSPHEEELKKFGNKWVDRFRDLNKNELESLSSFVGGKLDNLGIGEEWALTKEFFPEVRLHLSYHFHGEEFSDYGGKDMIRFLFSGERVQSVTGEDLAGMIEVMLNLIGRNLSDNATGKEVNNEIHEKYYEPRKKALEYLNINNEEEIENLARFLGGIYEFNNSNISLEKNFFPEVKIKVKISDNDLEVYYSGSNTKWLVQHELNLISVYTLNHIIRFIAGEKDERGLPEICSKVFPK